MRQIKLDQDGIKLQALVYDWILRYKDCEDGRWMELDLDHI